MVGGRNGLYQQPEMWPELQNSGWGSSFRGSEENCVVLELPFGSSCWSGSVCSPAVGLPGCFCLEKLVLPPLDLCVMVWGVTAESLAPAEGKLAGGKESKTTEVYPQNTPVKSKIGYVHANAQVSHPWACDGGVCCREVSQNGRGLRVCGGAAGLGSAGVTVGLEDLQGLFQPEQFCDSMILWFSAATARSPVSPRVPAVPLTVSSPHSAAAAAAGRAAAPAPGRLRRGGGAEGAPEDPPQLPV